MNPETTRLHPENAAVELTLRCNARCVHCGSTAGGPRDGELDLSEWAAVFRSLSALGGREVCLLGGEPMLVPWWRDAVAAAAGSGLSVVVITNGSLLDGKDARFLRHAAVSRVAVSLDGSTPGVHDRVRGRQGSFDEAATAISLLLDAGVEAGAITTVMKSNLQDLPGIRDLLLGRGVGWQIQVAGCSGGRFGRDLFLDADGFYSVGEFIDRCRREYTVEELPVAGAHDVGYFSSSLRDYGETPQALWRGCRAGLDVIGVTSNGGVKGCLSLPDSCVEANLRERALGDIWQDPALFARNRRFMVEDLSGACRCCEYALECRAGCLEMCFSTTGTMRENLLCFRRIEGERLGAVQRAFSPRSRSNGT